MPKNLKIILSYWLPVILWMGVIFYLSNQPDLKTDLGVWDLVLRKIAHMFEFGVLVLLFWRAFKQFCPIFIRTVIYSGLATLIYAILDEVHQMFITKRVGSYLDVLIDLAGIVIMILIIIFVHRSQETRKIKKQFE